MVQTVIGTTRWTAPSLSRDALAGRLAPALAALEGRDDPGAAWQRGWLLAALGDYGAALDQLDTTRDGSPAVQAAGLMTGAQVLREIGLHEDAEAADQRGLGILGDTGRCPPVRAALLIGLVADAVGRAADEVLSRRLQRAAAAVDVAGSWRQLIAFRWVQGEVAMVRGGWADAERAFGRAARRAARQGARRHEAKSLVFLAAARAAAGEHEQARRIARRGLELAARCAAAPLVWPAEMVLAEVDADAAAVHLDRARGILDGLLATLPAPLAGRARRRPPASWLLADPMGRSSSPAGDLQ